MISEDKLEERRKLAAQMVLESGVVTPALDDDQAEVLLYWALGQAGSCAVASRDMDEREASGHIARGVARVRRLMGIVNDIVEHWYDLDQVQMVEQLTQLMSAAMDVEDRRVG